MFKSKLIKESWNFHGFQSGETSDSIEEYISPVVWFRIVNSKKQLIGPDKVQRLGWPVSNYKIEKISQEEAESLKSSSTYDDFYKSYRK